MEVDGGESGNESGSIEEDNSRSERGNESRNEEEKSDDENEDDDKTSEMNSDDEGSMVQLRWEETPSNSSEV